MSTSETRIFLLSLAKEPFFDDMYKRLIDTISSKATIQRATKPTAALTYLSNNTPTAIFITDPGIVERKHSAVLEKVVSYARNGGTVILGGHFSGFIRPTELDNFFRSGWDLPWEFGDYHRTTVYVNQQVQEQLAADARAGLPAAYSQKAVFLKSVPTDAALYVTTEDSVTQSLVFPSKPVGDRGQTPVVFAAVGEGKLGYVGDVNAEEGSDAVILAMCGL